MNNDISHKALKVVLFSQLLVEAIDDVKDTSLYQYKAKQILNNVERILKPNIKINDDVYDEDPEITTNLFNILDSLISKLASNDLVQLMTINQIIEKHNENPKRFEEEFQLEVTKLNT